MNLYKSTFKHKDKKTGVIRELPDYVVAENFNDMLKKVDEKWQGYDNDIVKYDLIATDVIF